MDALGTGAGSIVGMLSGTKVAQKLSDNILAGRINSTSYSGTGNGASLTYTGYSIFYLILSNDEGYSISTFTTSSNRVNIPSGGYWNNGKLYGYRV